MTLGSMHATLSKIVCQSFTSLFLAQQSKNVLVVGASSFEKRLLIEALAGETEMRLIIDNSRRYSLVIKEITVGIKYLAQIFQAIPRFSPCLFLLEDIHILGEQRPAMVDEDIVHSAYSINQGLQMQYLMLPFEWKDPRPYYAMSRQLKFHRHPLRGALNPAAGVFAKVHVFESVFTKWRMAGPRLSEYNFIAFEVDKEAAEKRKEIKEPIRGDKERIRYAARMPSSLSVHIDTSRRFTPLPISAETVLALKEKKRFKREKQVEEMALLRVMRTQFNTELALRINVWEYSMRLKVAALSNLVLTNLYVQLDRVIDLLLVLDTVRSHRGVIVFASTHAPETLDRALRRPGRFNETVGVPAFPSALTRWFNTRSIFEDLRSTYCKSYSFPVTGQITRGVTINIAQLYSGPKSDVISLAQRKQITDIIELKDNPKYQVFLEKLRISENPTFYDETINQFWRLSDPAAHQLLSKADTVDEGIIYGTTLRELFSKTELKQTLSGRDRRPGLYDMQSNDNLTLEKPGTLVDLVNFEIHARSFVKISLGRKFFKPHFRNNLNLSKRQKRLLDTWSMYNSQRQSPVRVFPHETPTTAWMRQYRATTEDTQGFSKTKFLNYSQACKSIVTLVLFSTDPKAEEKPELNLMRRKFELTYSMDLNDSKNFLQQLSRYYALYESPNFVKLALMYLFSGRVGEAFVNLTDRGWKRRKTSQLQNTFSPSSPFGSPLRSSSSPKGRSESRSEDEQINPAFGKTLGQKPIESPASASPSASNLDSASASASLEFDENENTISN
ncbi:MAG: hypothetical protein NT027_01270, partial [Proteobacteria bacterium]|nr:hypothetical protein [Pseudomonadota bacterium]